MRMIYQMLAGMEAEETYPQPFPEGKEAGAFPAVVVAVSRVYARILRTFM